MTTRLSGAVRALVALAALLAAPAAAPADRLPRLPTDYVFARGDGSPGAVTFSHASHVDAAKPSCGTCHPRTFRILESGKPSDGARVEHARMEKGAACGACHGKTAFNFETCDNCHK
jgi:c(7)-type cytochrome triheme protein